VLSGVIGGPCLQQAGSNNSRSYVVSIIDCFSKYAWLLSITQKKKEKVLEVLRQFLKEHTPKVLQSDNRGNFTNACMKELLDNLHIKHTTSLPFKPSSNGQVEHFNRTIKGMIIQYMAANNLCRYLVILPKIVENYNNTYHTTIKSTPVAVWAGDHIGRARKNSHRQLSYQCFYLPFIFSPFLGLREGANKSPGHVPKYCP